jgi:hypothetical protein
MDAEISLQVIKVQQELSCLADAGYGFERVAVTQERKVSYSVKLEQKWAGNHKEVANHQVGCPGAEQVGEAVEYIKDTFSFPVDYVVDLGGERFKAAGCAEIVSCNTAYKRFCGRRDKLSQRKA